MKIQILTDNPQSWVIPHAQQLLEILKRDGYNAQHIHSHSELSPSDILFLLSCERLLDTSKRALNKHNLVVHASDVPQGRGWSPMTWQVLEGKNKIPIVMLEAAEGADTGDVYIRSYIQLDGHELVEEIRHKLGQKTVEMCIEFVKNSGLLKAIPQNGTPTIYPRRKPQDAALDVNQSLASQFNLLRISDNERYPAFFDLNGHKYILKIYKEEKL